MKKVLLFSLFPVLGLVVSQMLPAMVGEQVMGMNPTGDGEQVLEAEVPMAEMMSYAIDLRSMTQSRGKFTFNFVRYEDCPAAAQETAIAAAKALAEAE